MIHPNDMSHWDEIRCQRGHPEDGHADRLVSVLVGSHGYRDLPLVPRHLERSFGIYLWNTTLHPVDGGPYCPAHDAVSETIMNLGIGEPAETILVSQVASTALPESKMLDVGAHIGWFSLLAASWGLTVGAIDADPENLRLLNRSAMYNGWSHRIFTSCERIDDDSAAVHGDGSDISRVRLVKIDIEGAENHEIRVLQQALDQALIDHLLIEVSPVFADYYPDLVLDLIGKGYEAFIVPPKRTPPWPLADIPRDMAPHRIDQWPEAQLRSFIADCHQINVWFKHETASW